MEPGNPRHGTFRNPVISADGRLLLFQSTASDLTQALNEGNPGLFLHDAQAEITRLVSRRGSENEATRDFPARVKLSAHGRTIAFDSFADYGSSGDANLTVDAFAVQLSAPDNISLRFQRENSP